MLIRLSVVGLPRGCGGDWFLISLSTATQLTVALSSAPVGHLVLLVSDGVSDQTAPAALEQLVREYAADPQALDEPVVAAAEADDAGYRDDATAIVLTVQL
ncbi:hypothetical protein [Streptomyces sp. NPDC020141]|uniref:hypothetical protein n=1 Tax=Streptomyces sp. NPDC020141 TaxID=3365065 RepID=UPI0037B63DF6